MSTFRAATAAVAAAIMISLAGPTSAENVLRWGNANDAFTLDPHSFDHTHTEELQQQIYETPDRPRFRHERVGPSRGLLEAAEPDHVAV